MRGEIILKLSDMKKAFPGAANPRNQAAGTSKRFDGQGCEHLTVLFYDLDGESSATTEEEKFERPRATLGLVVPNCEGADLDGALALHREYAQDPARALDYEIDGLVVRANDVHVQHMLGELGNRAARRDRVQVRVAGEGHDARRHRLGDGLDGPRVAGRDRRAGRARRARSCSARRCTTPATIAALGIGIGDEVLVSRRNDVIPYVEEVVDQEGQDREAADEVRDLQARRS